MLNPEKTIITTINFKVDLSKSVQEIEFTLPNNACPVCVNHYLDIGWILTYMYKQNLIIVPKNVKLLVIRENAEFFPSDYVYLSNVCQATSRMHVFASRNFMLGELVDENN